MNIRYILTRLASSDEIKISSDTTLKSSEEVKISSVPVKTSWRDILYKTRPIIETTLIGTGARWVTWPLEIAFYQASIAQKPFSYFSIYKQNLKWSALPELNKSFLKTGLIQTILKSSCGPPILIYFKQFHSDLNTNQTIVFSTIISSILETIFTSRGEYYKVRHILKKKKTNNDHKTEKIQQEPSPVFSQSFGRVAIATFVRLVWSGFFTMGSFCKTREFLKTYFPKEAAEYPTLVDPVASIISSFATQWIIKPGVKYQTIVLSNPNKPILEITKEFLMSGNKMQGAWGRAIQRGAMYSLTWFFAAKLQQYHEQNDMQENKISENRSSLRK